MALSTGRVVCKKWQLGGAININGQAEALMLGKGVACLVSEQA